MARTLIPASMLAGSIGSSLIDKSGTWDFGTVRESGQDLARLTELPASVDFKESAKVISTNVANLALPGALSGAGCRVALVGQTDKSQNGLYDFVDGTTALTRCADASDDQEVTLGMSFFDDAKPGEMWVLISKTGNLDTGDLSFAKRESGLVIQTIETVGDGTKLNWDLGHSGAMPMLIAVGGSVMRSGAGNDFQFNAGAGAGGVDRLDFAFAPDNGVNIVIRYATRA